MRVFLVALLSLVASTTFIASAEADTIVAGGIFGFQDSTSVGFAPPVQVGTFNTSFGTLTNISIVLEGTAFADFTVTNNPTAGYYNTEASAFDGALGALPNNYQLPSQSLYLPQGGGNASAFWDLLSTIDITTDLYFYENNSQDAVISGGIRAALVDLPVNFDFSGFYQGVYTETFTYTPVPEPLALGLLAVGLIAILAAKALRDSTSPAIFSAHRS